MPELSRFFGIIITLYYDDHGPPHFHVRYGNQRALVPIDGLSVIAGELSPRVRGLVVEWVALQCRIARSVQPRDATRAAEGDSAVGVK